MEIRISQAEAARCQETSPVIWFESGLGQTADQWLPVLNHLQGQFMTVRTTRTDPERPENFPEHWSTMMHALAGCAKRIIPDSGPWGKRPVILVGHSYGSLLIRGWADWLHRHPAPNYRIASMLSIDPSIEGNFEGRSQLYRSLERRVSEKLAPRYAQELPHFYQAWRELQSRPLVYSAQHHVLAANRPGEHWHNLFQRRLIQKGQQWIANSRSHRLPTTEPKSIALTITHVLVANALRTEEY